MFVEHRNDSMSADLEVLTPAALILSVWTRQHRYRRTRAIRASLKLCKLIEYKFGSCRVTFRRCSNIFVAKRRRQTHFVFICNFSQITPPNHFNTLELLTASNNQSCYIYITHTCHSINMKISETSPLFSQIQFRQKLSERQVDLMADD